MNDWEYGWDTTNGSGGWGLTREEAQAAVDAWNDRADGLRRAANGAASYPSAHIKRRRPAVEAGPWEPVPRDTPDDEAAIGDRFTLE